MPVSQILKPSATVKNELLKAKLTLNWYVFYTAPRAEKVVKNELLFRGYEVFLPITKTFRIWKNRQRKMIDQVLFPSYIFVNTEKHNIYDICKIPKICTYIHCGGKPSIVNERCIEGIKRILNQNYDVSVEPSFHEGENVRILFGPLAGYEGILIKQKSKSRFGIELKEINQIVFIDICTSVLERI